MRFVHLAEKVSVAAAAGSHSKGWASPRGPWRKMRMPPALRGPCSPWITLCILLGFTCRGRDCQEPSPLDTLQCHNDYLSHINCSWRESVAARRFVRLRLFHWQNLGILPNGTCDPPGPGRVLGSHVALSCRQESDTFGIPLEDLYTFIPEPEVEARLSVDLWESVRPPPPWKLKINVSDTGDFLLSWETLYQRNQSRLTLLDLEYEVQYRRDWEHWENSHSLLVPNGTRCTLRSRQLVPGSTYVARIRARPREEGSLRGAWSEWSSELSWNVSEETAAAPKNLQCSFNGASVMRCTWEVRAEVTESVTFIMYYRESVEASEALCRPQQWKHVPGVHIRFYSCEVPVSNPQGRFQVSIRPETKIKGFEQCLHIKPAPPVNLKWSVDSRDPEVYHFSWDPKPFSYPNIEQSYQFCYRRKTEKGDEDEGFTEFPSGCPPPSKLLDISNGPPRLSFNLMTQLDPVSKYTARVRAHVLSKEPNTSYYGTWSEWSEPVTWETGSVWDQRILLVLVPVLLILLVVCAVYSYGYLKRSHKQWEEKIPNPSKSKLLASFLQKSSQALHSSFRDPDITRHGPPEMEDPRSCALTLEGKEAPDMARIDPKMETPFPEKSGSSAQTLPWTDSRLHSESGQSWGYQLFLEPGDDSKSRHESAFSDAASSCSDFNGPYLLFPRGSRLSNDFTESRAGKMEVPCQSLGYITIPPSAGMMPDAPNAATVPFGYILIPPEVCTSVSPTLKSPEEGRLNHQGQAAVDAYQKWPLAVKMATFDGQTDLSSKEEAPPAVLPADYVMLPPGLLQMDTDSPAPSSFHQPKDKPSEDPDPGEGLILAPAKQAGSLSDGYVVAPTMTHRIMAAPEALPGSTTETGDLPADRLVIFSPDGVSPVLLQQVGDYCFFPGSTAPEHATEGCDGEKVPPAGPNQKPPPSLVAGDGQPGVALPHANVIQMFKFMRNDYVALP